MRALLAGAAHGLRRRIPVSLGAKLVLILTAVGLLGSAAITLLLAAIITPSFNQLENSAVSAHVERTRAALADFGAKLETAVRDYGDWTDSYDYMGRPNRAFEEDSFSTTAMANLAVPGMAYVRPDGSVVLARWIDTATQEDSPEMKARFLHKLAPVDLDAIAGSDSSGSFYMRLDDMIAAIGVARIRRSDGTGDPRGYVVMARTLTSDQLSRLLQISARLDLDTQVRELTVVPHVSRVEIAVPVRGPGDTPVATAAYSVPRDLSLLGKRMLLFATLGTVLLMGVVLIVLRRAIARLVLRPLHRVERHMGLVRESGSMRLLKEAPRDDEIGSLVTSFNSMLRQLKDLREQLEMQSFKLGRSESAVAVMHNVRNALNPISTILSQGLGRSEAVDRGLIDKAVAELIRDDLPPARRQKLAAFLAAATEAMEAEREERRRQLEVGREALHHVLEIIGKQQEAAHERPQLEACDISDIIAQNATIARYSGGSSIAFGFPSTPHWVRANRVILSQVVGNLFANAAEAIAATGRESGSISVSVTEAEDSVRVVIRDDGDGFEPGSAPTLFQRGFSTRKHKSGGLGLHWCANALGAMQGKLELRSDGPGTGARAVLTLQAAGEMRDSEDLAA
ncbi:CHASE4 domain-containing protein [Sphingosinithalassobacter sp. CS137]|uniref:sensor histidine kinase n=1 Tax=Sphingosinithalassobacter sp. CS137 TaxID=2762748 RepID=UPI00165D358C|nr:CHASE4 domain-containing protein [Sphingosinithalassobacter sp. CS137]